MSFFCLLLTVLLSVEFFSAMSSSCKLFLFRIFQPLKIIDQLKVGVCVGSSSKWVGLLTAYSVCIVYVAVIIVTVDFIFCLMQYSYLKTAVGSIVVLLFASFSLR